MNILILSLDQALVGGSQSGDTNQRLLAYSQHCRPITLLIPTTQPAHTLRQGRVVIIPVFASNKFIAYLKLFIQTVRTLNTNKPDLVVCNDPTLASIAIIANLVGSRKAKVEVNVLGNRLTNRAWIFERWHHPLLWLTHVFAIYLSDHIRTDNTGDQRILTQKFKIPKSKIAVIPMPPSQAHQRLIAATKADKDFKHKLVGKNYMFLSIGTLTKNKDFITLIQAIPQVIKQHPNTTFVVVGDGPEKQSLIIAAKRLGVSGHIKHLHTQSYTDLPKLYAAADAYILSSNQEGLPRVLMEAALAHCPIITTDIFGARDLITNHQSGLIVPTNSPTELAKAINFAISHPKQMASFAAQAYKHAKKYLDFDANVTKLINSWQSQTAL